MKINLNIIAGSMEEVKTVLLGLLNNPEKIPSANVKKSDEVSETIATPEFAPEENTGKIPEPDVKNSDFSPAEADEEAPGTAEAQTAPPTMEETRAVLNELRKKNGAKAVKAILSLFSATSFTELEPSEYAAVIEEARRAYGKDTEADDAAD